MNTASSSIDVDPEILSGTPVFCRDARACSDLRGLLEGPDRLDDFLTDFPTVTREQIAAVLEVADEAVTRYARSA
jgi:uncharacterized protein (DUF433 family)